MSKVIINNQNNDIFNLLARFPLHFECICILTFLQFNSIEILNAADLHIFAICSVFSVLVFCPQVFSSQL